MPAVLLNCCYSTASFQAAAGPQAGTFLLCFFQSKLPATPKLVTIYCDRRQAAALREKVAGQKTQNLKQ